LKHKLNGDSFKGNWVEANSNEEASGHGIGAIGTSCISNFDVDDYYSNC
jgi:hypothetical protein